MEYKEKYLKYKSKYLDLKSKVGGLNLKMPEFLKSKERKEREAEEKRLQLEKIENDRKARQAEYEAQLAADKKMFEERRLQHEKKEKLIKQYEELGYKYNAYKRNRINIPTELDNEHVKYFDATNYALPPDVKQVIYTTTWEKDIIGLKDKFIAFTKKFYIPFRKHGYYYSSTTDSYYDHNQGITIPSSPASFTFFSPGVITKHPHSQKIYINDRFNQKPELPAFENWAEGYKPNSSPGKEWKRISASEPEWDPQNQHFYMTEKWESSNGDNTKVILEKDWETELAKLAKL